MQIVSSWSSTMVSESLADGQQTIASETQLVADGSDVAIGQRGWMCGVAAPPGGSSHAGVRCVARESCGQVATKDEKMGRSTRDASAPDAGLDEMEGG